MGLGAQNIFSEGFYYLLDSDGLKGVELSDSESDLITFFFTVVFLWT